MLSKEEAKNSYKEFAEAYLREIYSIESLENGFKNCSAIFMPAVGTDRLIFLFNEPRIENLTEEEFSYLSEISGKPAEDLDGKELVDFMEKTYRKVLYLPGWENNKGSKGEFFPHYKGAGIFPVDSILFFLNDSSPSLSPEEMDLEEEKRKMRIFLNVKAQFEKIANKDDKDFVWLLRN